MRPNEALIIVDVQNDFCPGGALAVAEGDQVVPVMNRWIQRASAGGAQVVASRDWHPPRHVSFQEQGGPWPPHCIQGTWGAEFHQDLQLPVDCLVVHKGMSQDKDNYSAFDATGLADTLRRRSVRRLWIGGLAQDVCVRATVLDASQSGFEVHVIKEGTRPVEPAAGGQALDEMKRAGAIIETNAD